MNDHGAHSAVRAAFGGLVAEFGIERVTIALREFIAEQKRVPSYVELLARMYMQDGPQ